MIMVGFGRVPKFGWTVSEATNLHRTINLFFKSSELESCEDYGCVKVYKSGEVELDGNQS
jgi:hypothetical protein